MTPTDLASMFTTRVPGMAPGATKRNALVLLLYAVLSLVVFGVVEAIILSSFRTQMDATGPERIKLQRPPNVRPAPGEILADLLLGDAELLAQLRPVQRPRVPGLADALRYS